MANDRSAPPLPEPSTGRGHSRPRRLSTRQLFGEDRRIVIEHRGARYELRITRQGKLILTK
jgi:hemin uptake protein HemP